MKISKILSSLMLTSTLIISSGCGSSTESDTNTTNNTSTTSNTNTTSVNGTVVDGPIYNAKVCVDYNFNSKCDSDEPSATTDINGSYTLSNVDLTQNAPLLVVPQSNTIDTSTAKPFTKILSAPLDGSNVNINPLTTIVGAKIYELYQEGNLSKESVSEIESEVAKSLGVNDLTSINILENPSLYAKAVAIAQILPDSNYSITELNQKIDFDKIKEGDFSSAINDTTIQNILSNLNNENLDDINDPAIIQTAIENAVKNNETNISNITELGLKDILTKNVFYKQDEDGLPIIFDENNSYLNINKDENETGTWKIDGDTVVLDSTDGSETNITLKSINAYVYEVNGKAIDSNGTINNFEDMVLAISKDINGSNIYKLPGITPLTSSDIAGKVYYNKDDRIYTIFDSNGTYEERDENGTIRYTTTWSINNGVLEWEGKDGDDSWIVKVVRFGDYLFALEVKGDKITKGYILPVNELQSNINVPSASNITDGNTNNTITTTYPITEYIGSLWGYNWYKIDAFYDGDTRFEGNDVKLYTDNDYIVLRAYKKDNNDSRAQISTNLNNASGFSADVNLLTDNIYSEFQVLAISKGNIDISEPLGDLTNTSNLTFIAGLSIKKNTIIYWWDVEDPVTGKYYEDNVGYQNYNEDLTSLVEDGSDVRVEISSNDSNITYKVIRLDTNETIFDKTLNIADTKITNFKGFNIASFRSRVRDDKANENGDEAIDKSENIINDFSVNEPNISVDEFLSKIDFTPINISTDTFANKFVLVIDNPDDLDYFDDSGEFHTFYDGEWNEAPYEIENNVLVVSPNAHPAFIALKDINGSYVDGALYDDEDGLTSFPALLINADMNTTITSAADFLNTMNSYTPLDTFNNLNGVTWTVDKEDNLTVTFNDDNTFSMSNGISGNWSLEEDNKVLHLSVTNDSDNLHIKNIFAVKVGENVFYVMTEDEDHIIKANGFTLN